MWKWKKEEEKTANKLDTLANRACLFPARNNDYGFPLKQELKNEND